MCIEYILLIFLGDIYSFNPDDWEPYDKELQQDNSTRVQYRVVDVNRESLCNLQDKYTFFPDFYSFHEGTLICKRFGEKRSDVSTRQMVDAVDGFLNSVK